ncbi:SWIM-type domain-containing protein [Citrus sinensis]|uniref:SWIM-type domain-containing protein n=1 Tax=Citrus sinensis TaxID=2711 RepID=A0ACB8L966_CITSI|nr:SWIM-type domain-containing protein [Citrus sinensis]
MAQIPSSGAKQLLETDMELLSFVNLMLSRKITLLLLEMKSLPSEAMQSDILENNQTSFIPENSSENTLEGMFEAYKEGNKPTMADAINHEQIDNEDVENIIDPNDNSDFDNNALLSYYESGDEDTSPDDFHLNLDEDSIQMMARELRAQRFRQMADEEIILEVGQVFSTIDEFKSVLKDFAIQQGCVLHKEKNERARVTALCANKRCKWRIHASLMVDKISFMIKTIKGGAHTCVPLIKNLETTSKWVVEKLFSVIKSNPGISSSSIAYVLLSRFGTATNRRRLYRVKKRVLKMCEGDYINSYALLNDYANVLLMTNNDATVKISQELVGNENKFKRIFISFKAQQQGFMKGCRGFIGLDGCHLKTSFGGILISVVALDANNGVFPLAVCLCEVESRESWTWFLELFKEHMDIHNDMAISFMSDRQKGLIHALQDVFPSSKTRYCARHVYANFRKQHSAEILREHFWKAARATNKIDFDDAMTAINKIDENAYKWLVDNDPSTWSCHHFDPFYKTDHVTNNMSESWNSYLNEYRRKPILELLEFIRMKLMKRMIRRREKCEDWESNIPPRVQKKIAKIAKAARRVSIIKASKYQFEVVEIMPDMERHYIVDLNKWYCECGGWQMSGLPCKHAMAGILHSHGEPSDYVDKSLTREAYLLTYSATINPLPDRINWPKIDRPILKPPVKKVQPERPKLNRRKEVNEAKKKPFYKRRFTVKCSICHEMGHNKKKCPANKGKDVCSSSTNYQALAEREALPVGVGTNKAHQLIGQQQLSTSIKVKQSKVRSMQASQAQINQVVAQAQPEQAPGIYGPQITIGQQQQPAYIIVRQRRARQGHDQGTGNNNNNGVINTEPVLKKVRKESKDRLNATQPSTSMPDGFGDCM